GEEGGWEVGAWGEGGVERREAGGVAPGIEALNEGSRRRPEPAEEPHQPGAEQRDATVGERGREERDDLAVQRVLVAGRVLDGVAADAGVVVILAVQALERPTEPRHARRADSPGHRAEG